MDAMPVVRTSVKPLQAGNRPEWCDVTSAGVFRVPAAGGTFDLHFHDFDEYWLVFRGRAKIRSEGVAYYVMPGDIVCTRAGEEHDVLEVYEELEAFWFEGPCPPGGRTGHLHRSPDLAKGHPVPHLALPRDFEAGP
jgi:mannose-6-phosphate isomerase-like protein (cupin superfamily)